MSMLSTVVSNLFGGPATLMYPVKPREPYARTRGQIALNESLCDGCGNCARRCPAVAIEIVKEKKQWILYPDRCIICEVCADACNRNAIEVLPKWRTPFYKREQIVFQSKGGKEVKEKAGECPVEEV
jgi:formate hydrogenlyase subunit 6/NADH:ubiquinone oxidoreductase subunit I